MRITAFVVAALAIALANPLSATDNDLLENPPGRWMIWDQVEGGYVPVKANYPLRGQPWAIEFISPSGALCIATLRGNGSGLSCDFSKSIRKGGW